MWEENKFEIIAEKVRSPCPVFQVLLTYRCPQMLEMERNERNPNEELSAWTAKECKRRWEELFQPQSQLPAQTRALDETTQTRDIYSNPDDTREETRPHPTPPSTRSRKRQRTR